MSFYKEVPGRKTTLESTLKFDTAPIEGSTNPVTSEGVKTAIEGAVGDASEALQEQIDEIAEKAGSGYIPKGEATVATLNALSGQENGELYTMTDAGTLTDGSLAVVAGDTVAWDATNSVWYKAMNYAPAQYGTNEAHNLTTSITAFRTGDVIPVDGPDGTAKMGKGDLLRATAENALGSIHSLSGTATEVDLVAGEYLVLDGNGGTKKLDVSIIEKTNDVGYFSILQNISTGTAFDFVVYPLPLKAGTKVKVVVTTDSTADLGYLALAWNDTAPSKILVGKAVTPNSSQVFETILPYDANTIHIWENAQNVRAGGTITMRVEIGGLYDLVETCEENQKQISDFLGIKLGAVNCIKNTLLDEVIYTNSLAAGTRVKVTITSLSTASLSYLALCYDSASSGKIISAKRLSPEGTIELYGVLPYDANNLRLWEPAGNVLESGKIVFNLEINPSSNIELTDFIVPEKIYVVYNDKNASRNYSLKMYADHCIYNRSEKTEVSFNGCPTLDFYGKGETYKNGIYVNNTVKWVEKDIYIYDVASKIRTNFARDKDVSIQLVSTRVRATMDGIVRLLCIGDSVTEGYLANKGIPYPSAPCAYWAWVKALFEMDAAEVTGKYYFESLGNLIASRNEGVSFDIDFNGISRQGIKAYACGVGGSKTGDWLSATLNNGVVNPFYDGSKFSLQYWVENYRTLIVGANGKTTRCDDSNKGPLAGDVNATNVCEPTHVLIQLGYNQRYKTAGTTRDTYISHLTSMIQTIASEYPSVKVLLSLPDTPCAYNVERFDSIGHSQDDIWSVDASYGTAKDAHDCFAFMNKDLMDIASNNSNCIYVPTFFAVPSLFGMNTRNVTEVAYLSNGKQGCESRVASGDNVQLHPNNAAHANIAYQIYSYLKYDIANNA